MTGNLKKVPKDPLFPQKIVGVFLKVVARYFGFRHSGDATHANGRQGVRNAEPNARFGISTKLDPPVRSDSRGFRRLRP